MPLDQLSVGIEVDQLLGHLFDILLDPGGGPGPARAAEAIQPWDVAFRAAIALDLVQPIEWHIQGVAARELEDEKIAFEILHRETLEPPILGNAVLDVHDIVADAQVFERREKGRGSAFWLGL